MTVPALQSTGEHDQQNTKQKMEDAQRLGDLKFLLKKNDIHPDWGIQGIYRTLLHEYS